MNHSPAAARQTATTPSTPEALGALLLALYQAARLPSVQQFQEQAIQALRRLLPFDASLWGIGTLVEGHTHTHGAHVWNMPPDAVDLLNLTESHNVVAQRCTAVPDVAHVFKAQDLYANAQTAILAQYQGVRQVLCMATIDRLSSLVGYVSLARQGDEPPFGAEDQRWLTLLMPHLNAMLHLSRVAQIDQIRSQRGTAPTRLAVTDIKGILHVMEPGFDQLLREEWPDWRGPWLPAGLLKAQATGTHRFLGKHLQVDISGVAEQLLVTLTRNGPSDRLTRQERACAQAYAQGLSYKEVARELGLAPATVRHHLRETYAKLGIRDKAALAQLMSQSA